jgi:protein-disulfide isomerase
LTIKSALAALLQAGRMLSTGAGLGVALALSGCSTGIADLAMPAIELPSVDLGLSPQDADKQPKEQAAEAPQPVSIAELMKPGPLGEKTMGKPNAPVTVIEYASLTCPICAAFHKSTFPQFKKAYVDTGKVFYIYRDFPIGHASATATQAVHCAPEKDYFKLVDKFYAQQSDWVAQDVKVDAIYNVVKETRMKREAFDTCLKNQNINDGLVWVQERGRQFGVNGTPTFFINGQKTRGGLSMDELRKLIDPLLVNPSAKSNPQPSQGRPT